MPEEAQHKKVGFDHDPERKRGDCGRPNPCGDAKDRRSPPINVRPAPSEDEFSGFIIVRLGIDRVETGFERLEHLARKLELRGLAAILEEFGNPGSQRLIRSLEPRRLLEMETAAAKSDLPPLRSLNAYWRLDLRERPEVVGALVDRLNELPAVALAYRELAVSDPVVNDSDDPYASGQTYLDPAPTGIDARWAWTQPNGEGAGVARHVRALVS